MIPVWFTYLIAISPVPDDTSWMPWMLGIFGGVISVLFLILVSLVRTGFSDQKTEVKELRDNIKEEIKEIRKDLYGLDARVQVIEAGTDKDELARHIVTVLRAGGSGGFNIDDFK